VDEEGGTVGRTEVTMGVHSDRNLLPLFNTEKSQSHVKDGMCNPWSATLMYPAA